MDANTLMPRKWRWDHNHLAVVQLIPAPVIGPPAQLGEADSRIHSAHAVHSTSSVAKLRLEPPSNGPVGDNGESSLLGGRFAAALRQLLKPTLPHPQGHRL